LIVSRFPEPLGGRDLGPVSNLQLHPTVAKLLGIEPATDAKANALDLNQK
jgi:hypothetical protein